MNNKPPDAIRLLILEPTGVAIEAHDAEYVSLPTGGGNLGLLPRRLDCAGAIIPGIVSWRANGERFAGVDEGMFVKCGGEVRVAVRQAIIGKDLANLRQAVEERFLKRKKEQVQFRLALSRMEAAMMREIVQLSREA